MAIVNPFTKHIFTPGEDINYEEAIAGDDPDSPSFGFGDTFDNNNPASTILINAIIKKHPEWGILNHK